MRKKITVVGAGNVGREVAFCCALKELGDITIWNRSKERALGNALDLMEAGPIAHFDANIVGTADIKKTKNSDIIIFTAGAPRKPGMKREDLVQNNANVIIPLTKKLAKASPKATLIMVTNPLDAMAYAAFKASKFPKNRVIGMAGMLDTSRFESFIAKALNVSIQQVSAPVLGSHGENMVPLPRFATVGGVPITQLLTSKKIEKLVNHTKKAGAEIVNLLHANASFSVGAATANLVEAIVKDTREVLPCSALLTGQYGLKNVFLGVPCIIGTNGIQKIIELKLNAQEKRHLSSAGKNIKALIKAIK